jgi:hypothetical protein
MLRNSYTLAMAATLNFSALGVQALMERFDELLSTSRDEEKEPKDDSVGDVTSRKHDRDSSQDVSKRKRP